MIRDQRNELVSVITATYNRDRFLPCAVESVLNQTHRNLEYHIVDDGSTDETQKVVEPYLKDKRVHYYFQENRGQSIARNVGLKHSTGRFIAFLDSDDIWNLDKLELQLRIFEQNPEIDVVHSEIAHIDEKGCPLNRKNVNRYSGWITHRLLLSNCVTFDATLFRRECYEALGGLDESLRRSDDYELWLRFSTRFRFYYQPEKTVQVRITPGQISENKEARFDAIRLILNRFFEKYPDMVSGQVQKQVLSRYHIDRGRYRAQNANYMAALRDYVTSMTYSPFSFGPWRALLRMLLLWK